MKNFKKVCGIIMLIALFMTACDHGSGPGGGGGGINAGDLPEFPPGSNPAATMEDAEAVLAELRQSEIFYEINEEIWEVIWENSPSNSWNYSFSNRSLPNGYLRVSASETENITFTGGFKTIEDIYNAIYEIWAVIDELYDNYPIDWDEIERLEEEIDQLEEEIENTQLAVGDRYSETYTGTKKGELIKDKTTDGVTAVQGSTIENKWNESYNETVKTSGTYATDFGVNYNYTDNEKDLLAFTLTSSSGSIKFILDSTAEWIEAGYYETDGTYDWTETEKYSGSLKIYGANNALLIDHRINDYTTYRGAWAMIQEYGWEHCPNCGEFAYDPGYKCYSCNYPNVFNPVNVTPFSPNNWINGNLSSSNPVAWYSINVTNGTTYHLWWDDWDTNDQHADVMVCGYYSNGNLIFDKDWPNNYSFTASSTGTVYINVYPYSEGDTGTFTIAYNTTGIQPAGSILNIDPSRAAFSRLENKREPAAKQRKPIDSLRNNKRGFLKR